MSDVDVLDMLFEGNNSILGSELNPKVHHNHQPQSIEEGCSEASTYSAMDTLLMKPGGDAVGGVELPYGFNNVDSDWPSSSSVFTTSLDGLDHNEFFNALMEANLPDDVKQQQQQQQQQPILKPQQQQQQQQFSDHAYSIAPSSPHSDSGISSGPYSPSNSNNSIEDLTFDMDRDLFGPLDLKSYEDVDDSFIPGVDPMLMDSISECSSSPGLHGNESPVDFDFEDLETHSSQPVKGLTISTDETTKVIKVLSVNGTSHTQSLLSTLASRTKLVSDSPYPELTLSDEEKDLLRKEGISLPTHLPLTREEEKILRSVRRRIRNKASARNSRRKKQDYMDALEQRVKLCTDEKRQLQKKVIDLEKRNSSLIGQLKKLQRLVTDGTRQTAKAGTCAMILALSFALVLLPNYQSLLGENTSGQDTLMKAQSCDVSGRPSRSLLSKPDDYISSVPQADRSFNHIPFLKFDNMVSPAHEPVANTVRKDNTYIHDSVDDLDESTSKTLPAVQEKVIHMEITKLSDSSHNPVIEEVKNHTATAGVGRKSDDVVRRRHIRMDLDDEL